MDRIRDRIQQWERLHDQADQVIRNACAMVPSDQAMEEAMADPRVNLLPAMPMDRPDPDQDHRGSIAIADILSEAAPTRYADTFYPMQEVATDVARDVAYRALGLAPVVQDRTEPQFDMARIGDYRMVDNMVWLYSRAAVSGIVAEAIAGSSDDPDPTLDALGIDRIDIEVARLRFRMWRAGFGVYRVQVPDGIDPSLVSELASIDVFTTIESGVGDANRDH